MREELLPRAEKGRRAAVAGAQDEAVEIVRCLLVVLESAVAEAEDNLRSMERLVHRMGRLMR
ncbi:hypothetical protein E4U42_003016 [Claviceps africana]|uniref:Uncharacterized protein n=1 Tax=Claviceps africana TaxID=83212 RepID=A0A8K0NI64_9HYPO|nr:hypothetical protein E4U42_003016 [Claviceps africana]